jgi:hypothetical protein
MTWQRSRIRLDKDNRLAVARANSTSTNAAIAVALPIRRASSAAIASLKMLRRLLCLARE